MEINMNLSTYKNDDHVKDFINWIELKLSNEDSFNHSYISKKPINKFKFNNLYPYNYLKNNIIASWLLKLIIDKTRSKFNELPENIQLRALESALFMIGNKINYVIP
jgi:hypothetical protein